jgi:SAM-dependent methyltransferase
LAGTFCFSLRTAAQTKAKSEPPRLSIYASDLLEQSASSKPGHAHEFIGKAAYDGLDFEVKSLLAFEENRLFAFAMGDAWNGRHNTQGNKEPPRQPQVLRRFIFLKPGIFVVDDEVEASGSGTTEWLLYSRTRPDITEQWIRIAEQNSELLGETLLPQKVARKVTRGPSPGRDRDLYVATTRYRAKTGRLRILQVFQTRIRGDQSKAESKVWEDKGHLRLTISTGQRAFHLTLPSVRIGAGDISISKADGKTLLERRPLPAGVLPHGVEGVRLLEQWDAAYAGNQPPLWDAGRPSGDLTKIVEDGTMRPGRIVDLGCGSGTDAIYLAGRGFDVTAIDVAPAALRLAQEKALKAGVRVRWLLADVLALPRLEPFDLIYDRGCYHEVRSVNIAAYLRTVQQLSRPGTLFLLLAGNANEMLMDYGPPTVTEEQLRGDFSRLFDFEFLKESRFEIARPNTVGPLAWSALLRRKSDP